MKPMLVKKIISNTGTELEVFLPTPVRQVISSRTAHLVKSMMSQVVQEEGTGTRGQPLTATRYAGKPARPRRRPKGRKATQTASIQQHLADSPQRTDPKLAVLVVVDEPRKDHYGGIVAAPAFKTIMSKAFSYMNIPPETTSNTMIAAVTAPCKTTTHEEGRP